MSKAKKPLLLVFLEIQHGLVNSASSCDKESSLAKRFRSRMASRGWSSPLPVSTMWMLCGMSQGQMFLWRNIFEIEVMLKVHEFGSDTSTHEPLKNPNMVRLPKHDWKSTYTHGFGLIFEHLPFLAMMVKLWCPVSSSRNPPLYVTGAFSSLSWSDASLPGNVFTPRFWSENHSITYHPSNHVLKSLAAEMYSTSTLASGPNHFWMWIRSSTRRSFLICCLNESSFRPIIFRRIYACYTQTGSSVMITSWHHQTLLFPN